MIDKVLVQIHYLIVMIGWTGLAPWDSEFPFPGSLASTIQATSSSGWTRTSYTLNLPRETRQSVETKGCCQGFLNWHPKLLPQNPTLTTWSAGSGRQSLTRLADYIAEIKCFQIELARYPCHPAPHTLHPTPYTLHPTLYTLRPTPYTLHPAPYTPHPIPYTLSPES